MTILDDLISERGVLLIDGAMGTELFSRGLDSGDAPERWNLTEPDRVASVHQAYVDAGSDIVLTNSFGGTHFRLALHSLDDQVFELNQAAAAVCRSVTDDASKRVLVAGSMGPTGELLEPMGSMTPATCESAFAEQARGLAAGGADLIWIETMSDLGEIEAAVAGARSTCDLPIVTTLSFDTAGRTMMGVSGTDAVSHLAALGVSAVGANCGNTLADTEAAVQEMHEARSAGELPVLLVSKGNAGIPEWKGAELHYSGTPELMAAHAHRARAAGITIIGGCCGTTPDHLAKMRRVLDGIDPVPDVEIGEATVRPPADAGARRRSKRRRERSSE